MLFITLLFLSTNKTSMVNLIKKVWMELQGWIIRASGGRKSFLPNKPFTLLEKVLAKKASSATVVFLVLLIIFISTPGDSLPCLTGRQAIGSKDDPPCLPVRQGLGEKTTLC